MSIAEKLTAIAENEQKVFDAGKKAEYDAFWDVAQQNGSQTYYTYAFAGHCWNIKNFKPKYDMRPINASMMFHTTGVSGDLVEVLKNCGVVLDTTESTLVAQMFAYAGGLTRVGVIDTRKSGSLQMMFYSCRAMITIDKLILNENGTQDMGNTFANTDALENITIEGKIGYSGLRLDLAKKLSHDSLMNFIHALYDFSEAGETHTATFGATNLAKLTDAEKAIATQKGWTLA